jgi:hypothetical protein
MHASSNIKKIRGRAKHLNLTSLRAKHLNITSLPLSAGSAHEAYLSSEIL